MKDGSKKSFKEKLKDSFIILFNRLGAAIETWVEQKKEDNKIVREAVRKEKIKMRIAQKTAHLNNVYSNKRDTFSNSTNNNSIFNEERQRDDRWLN